MLLYPLLFSALLVRAGEAQQVADSAFAPDLGAPTFAPGEGLHVAIDGGHFDFHTVDGRYLTFARLLRADGYRVDGLDSPFSDQSLAGVDVLVVANALAEQNRLQKGWVLPNPSAFTPEEIAAVHRFVEGGGALLLVADHMPFPGSAAALAGSFGFKVSNGFAIGAGDDANGPMTFRRSDGSLAPSPVTDGEGPGTRVDSVVTFTGSAFRPPDGATSILVFRKGTTSFEPDTAWVFDDETPRVDVGGWSQGATLHVGRGRLAVFGEAAMFSAQRAGPERRPMGMNAPAASQNPRFLLNLIHWLTRAP